MTKKANLTTVTNTSNNTGAINANFERLNAKLDNTLSLDGSTPNAMNADLDMNTNDLLNVKNLWVKGDLIVDGVGSLLDTISGDRQTFDTQADLKAALSLVMGNTYATRGHTTVGDYGDNLYLIREDDIGDGSCVALTGMAGFAQGLFPGNIIRAEQFGCVLGDEGELAERSAEWNAAFAFAASRSAVYSDDDGLSTETDPVGATFTCYTHFKTKDILAMTDDGLHTGARVDSMTVDWRGFVIAVPGGFLETHTQTRPIPMVIVKLRFSTIYWPSLHPAHLCAGIKCKVDVSNKHFGLRLNGFSRYGLWKVANNDSPYSTLVIKQFTRDADLIENGVDHSDFTEWNGDGIVASTKDFLMDKVRVGWGGPCVRLLDTKPDDAARNIPGQNCYWCGLESAQGYVDGDNGTGDCFFNYIHMMQGLSGNTDFIAAGSGSRTGYYADYDFSTGGMIFRQVDTPIGILSFCKISNSSFFSRLDNDKCNHYLFGAQVSISDESPDSASTPRCSSTEDTDILDPRIRVFASRGNNGSQRYPYMFSMHDQRNMTVGFYDNPAEIYWNGSAMVEASTSWNGTWDKWNQLNTAHGTSYSGPVSWRGSLAAGTYSPSVTAAGDYWVAKGALTINPGGVSVTDGQILYALVASPASSGDWLVVNVDAAPVRSPSSFVSEITSQRIKAYTTAVNLLPQETTYVANNFFKHDYFVNGTKTSTIRGFGLPEGAVTAEPGSVYFDLTNKHLWTKATGTGNTGWKTTEHCNVMAFGAVADGETSDVAAANACIAFAMNSKSVAYFPSGRYAVDASINAYPAVSVANGAGNNRFWPVAIEGDNADTTVFVVKSSDPTIDIINFNDGAAIPSNARYYRSVKNIGFEIHPDFQSATTHPRYLNLGALWNGVVHNVFFAESRSTHMTGTKMSNLDVQNVSSSRGSVPFIYKDTTGLTITSSGANILTASGPIFSVADVGKTLSLSASADSPSQYTIAGYTSTTIVTVTPNVVTHTAVLFMFDPPRVTGTGTTLTAESDCFVAAHVGLWIWITAGLSATGGSVYARIDAILAPNQITISKTLGATISAPGVYFHSASIEITDEGGNSNDVIMSNVRVFHHSGCAFAGRDIRNLVITESKWHGDGTTNLDHYSATAMVLDWVEGSFSGIFGQRVMCPFRVYFLKQQDRDFFIPFLFTGSPTNARVFSLADFNGTGTVKVGMVSSGTANWWELATDANSTPRFKVTGMGNYKSSYTMTVSDGTTTVDVKSVNYTVSDSTVTVYLAFANNIDVSTLLATGSDLEFSLPFTVLYNSYMSVLVKQLAATTGPYMWHAKAGTTYAHIVVAATGTSLIRSDFNATTTDISGGTLVYVM